MGTWVVPGSHRDLRNPRGPADGITVTAPIPGDMQVSSPAGSVFIQDSRMWHSTACHNTSGKLRVAAQNRWVPWWFNAQYGGGEQGYGATPWLSEEDLVAMPEALQPLHCESLREFQDVVEKDFWREFECCYYEKDMARKLGFHSS